MSWTYDVELGTPRDEVRFTIGDTDFNDQQLQDETIDFLLNRFSNDVVSTSRACVRHLIARYSRFVDKWVGDLKVLASQRVEQYTVLLEQLQGADATGSALYGLPSAGGVYLMEKEVMAARTDLVKPSFRRGLHDNPDLGGLNRIGDDSV